MWVDNAPLVYVPAGEFTMGTGIGDAPKRTVSVDSFWIQQLEVTNGMYAQCVKVGSCTPPAQEIGAPVFTNPEFGSYPVVGVDWNQASAYCTWIQGRLPTEAEWEKAARGSNGNLYPWGNDDPACDVGNLTGCLGHTSDVTNHPDGKSPYGLYDTAGNVFEWVNDWYDASYYENAPAQNPTGPESGQYRVIRGSSFESDLNQILIGNRHFGGVAYHNYRSWFSLCCATAAAHRALLSTCRVCSGRSLHRIFFQALNVRFPMPKSMVITAMAEMALQPWIYRTMQIIK